MLSKEVVFLHFLSQGHVLASVDLRHPDVVVPSQLKGTTTLRFGYNLTPPITDMIVDDLGVKATLVFQGVPFTCHVPWDSVLALALEDSGHIVGWPPTVTHELEIEIEPSQGVKTSRPKLTLVP